MDLDKVKEIAEELLQDEAFVRTIFIQGRSYETTDPDPVVKAILVGSVYIAHVVADRLGGVGEDKESPEQTLSEQTESDLSQSFDSVLNSSDRELEKAKSSRDDTIRKVRMDDIYRYLRIANEIGYGSTDQKHKYKEVKARFSELAKLYELIYDWDCLA